MRIAAPLLALSLLACSAALRTEVPPGERALRLPQNQEGAILDRDLLRITWLPPIPSGSPDPAARAAFKGIGAAPARWLVASRAGGAGSLLTFAGRPEKYRGGLLDARKDVLPALARARARSAFHAPVKAQLGGADVWVVGDAVPCTIQASEGEHLFTLEVYEQDPHGAWERGELPAPARALVIARRGRDGAEVARTIGGVPFVPFRGFNEIVKVDRGQDGKLGAVEFAQWKPRVDAILGGATAASILQAGDPGGLEMERLLNDTLIEWKTRRLVDWARRAEPGQLEDAIVASEKGMMELDRRSRVLKDEIDAAARDGKGSQPALTEAAQLLDQRKTLVGVVVGTLKQARAAQRQADPLQAPAAR